MAKYAKIVILTMFFLFTYKIYAQDFYKVTPIPKEKIKYIEESVDSNNREIQFEQSFMACLKKHCFYIVPNKAKKDEDGDYDDYRNGCSVNIIDEKYDSKKDVDVIAENKITEENWRPHIPMWYEGPSYEAIMNNLCHDNPTVSSIAFINEKENERPIILVALNFGQKLKNKDSGYKFSILYFDGVKYRQYLNKKLHNYLYEKDLTSGKSIMVVKHEIEKWLKNNKK